MDTTQKSIWPFPNIQNKLEKKIIQETFLFMQSTVDPSKEVILNLLILWKHH